MHFLEKITKTSSSWKFYQSQVFTAEPAYPSILRFSPFKLNILKKNLEFIHKALSDNITGKSLRTQLKANCPIPTKHKKNQGFFFLRPDFIDPKLN